MLTSRGNSRCGFTAVEAAIVLIVIAIIVTVTMWQVDKRRQAQLREESAANLNALYATFNRLRANLGPGLQLPLISVIPGHLAPKLAGEDMQYLITEGTPTIFISPAHPDAERMREDALDSPVSAITDDSYWYLGYTLPNEGAGLAFVDAYRKTIEDTGKPPKEDVLKVSPYKIGAGPKRDWLARFGFNGVIDRPVADEDVNDLKQSGRLIITAPTSPVFIERPGLQRGGSNVLFLDGHVEFIPYPGKFPMTERFIKALESLDELKEPRGAIPEK